MTSAIWKSTESARCHKPFCNVSLLTLI